MLYYANTSTCEVGKKKHVFYFANQPQDGPTAEQVWIGEFMTMDVSLADKYLLVLRFNSLTEMTSNAA